MASRAIALVCVLALSCATPPQDKAEDAVRSLASWSATLSMVAAQWSAGKAPDRFARKTIAVAAAEVTKQRSALQSEKQKQTAAELQRACDLLAASVEREDHFEAAAVAKELERLAGQLREESSAP